MRRKHCTPYQHQFKSRLVKLNFRNGVPSCRVSGATVQSWRLKTSRKYKREPFRWTRCSNNGESQALRRSREEYSNYSHKLILSQCRKTDQVSMIEYTTKTSRDTQSSRQLIWLRINPLSNQAIFDQLQSTSNNSVVRSTCPTLTLLAEDVGP